MRGVLAALLLVATACSGVRERPATFDPRALGGPCPDRQRTYGARSAADSRGPLWGVLAQPGVWARVDSIDVGGIRGGSREWRAAVTVVGGDEDVAAVLPEPVRKLRMDRDQAEAVDDARALGGEVFVHLRADGPARGGDAADVTYAVAFEGDQIAFLGECAYAGFTTYVRQRLGADAAAEFRAVVGQPSAVVRRLVRDLPPWAPRRPVRIATLPAAERAGLRAGTLRLVAPPAFRGPYAVCSGVESHGWGECVDLARPGPRTARMWFPPRGKESTVTVWLMDGDPDYSRPVARLAVAHLWARARGQGVDLATDRVVLTVTVERAVPPLDTVVAEAARNEEFVAAFASWSLAGG